MSDLEHDTVITFKTERGTFDIARELFEDGNEDELRRAFARGLPMNVTSMSRAVHRDGSVTITWRKTRIVTLSG